MPAGRPGPSGGGSRMARPAGGNSYRGISDDARARGTRYPEDPKLKHPMVDRVANRFADRQARARDAQQQAASRTKAYLQEAEARQAAKARADVKAKAAKAQQQRSNAAKSRAKKAAGVSGGVAAAGGIGGVLVAATKETNKARVAKRGAEGPKRSTPTKPRVTRGAVNKGRRASK